MSHNHCRPTTDVNSRKGIIQETSPPRKPAQTTTGPRRRFGLVSNRKISAVETGAVSRDEAAQLRHVAASTDVVRFELINTFRFQRAVIEVLSHRMVGLRWVLFVFVLPDR